MRNLFSNYGPAVNVQSIGTNSVTANYNFPRSSRRRLRMTQNNNRQQLEAVPIFFGILQPNFPFIGRLCELERLTKALDQPPNAAIVSGLGGIGKTELIRRFIEQNRSLYKNIIWVDSKNVESIYSSFKKLAKNILGIKVAQKNDASIIEIIEQVFNKISKSKTLFVYDNVVEPESIQLIQLFVRMAPLQEKPHIIITSRVQDWGGIVVIRLKTWKIDDAIRYVKRTLNGGNDSKYDIKLLVNRLQAFPLALRQATAQINYNRFGQNFGISDYIRKYDTKQMLDYRLDEKHVYYSYKETTFTTWNSTIDTVKRGKNNGVLAVTILNIIAYFASYNIQRDIFLHFSYRKNPYLEMISNMVATFKLLRREKIDCEENIYSAVRLLINHCLVDINKNKNKIELNVNRLVQQVIKLKLQETNSEKLILRYAITLILKLIEHVQLHVWDKQAVWHKHAVSVFACLLKYRDLLDDFLAYQINTRECVFKYFRR